MNTIELAKECGALENSMSRDGDYNLCFTEPQLEALNEKIRADERGRCAKVCELNTVVLNCGNHTYELMKHDASDGSRHEGITYAEAIRNMTAGGEHE